MQPSAGPAWHVVHLYGRTDNAVKFWLAKMSLEFYYPYIRELVAIPRDRLSHAQRARGFKVWKPRIVPMFPRYMFVRFDFMVDKWREMFDIAGINGMICEQGLPVRVTDKLIQTLREREEEGAIPGATLAPKLFDVGDRVQIIGGAMAGKQGSVLAIPNVPIEDVDIRTRLRITIDLFGRTTPVDLDITQVRPLPMGPPKPTTTT